MHRLSFAIITITLFCTAAFSQSKLPSTTAAERSRVVSESLDLEANPMGPKAGDERSDLLMLLLERSNINVSACQTLLADIDKHDKDNYPILVQVWYSSARYAVQHNGGDAGSLDQQVAGVEGALRVYEKFVLARPEDRSTQMDAAIARRNAGTLREYVAQRAAGCK